MTSCVSKGVGYGAIRALIVLGRYAALGAILAIITDRIRAGAPAATSSGPR